MPWLDVYSDGRNGRIEFFYTGGASPQVTRLRCQNPTQQAYHLRVVAQNPDGTLGAVKLDVTFPPGSTPGSSDQAIDPGAFVLIPADNGGFNWSDYVEAGPVYPATRAH